jgi:hypothetical protein
VTELDQIRSYFYQGNYTAVLNEPIGSLSRSDLAQIYQYRSRIELGQASQVVEEMGQAGSTGGGFDAIKVFAEYRSGDKQRAVEDMVELIQADPEDDVVQVIGATVLSLEGRTDEALELLSKHENSLEAYGVDWGSFADERVAIIIQIRLAQNNHEAAEKELHAAKSWAQDSLLAQLAEVLTLLSFEMLICRPGCPLRKAVKGLREHSTFMKNSLNHPHPPQNRFSVRQSPKFNLADYRKPNPRSSRLLRRPLKTPISLQTQSFVLLSLARIILLISSMQYPLHWED